MISQKIQWLVMGAVVAVVGVVAGYSVLSARATLRDVTRLSNVRDVGIGLELYFRDAAAYPAAGKDKAALPLGTPVSACLQKEGFTATCGPDATTYMSNVAATPTAGLKKLSACGGVDNAYCYTTDGTTFRVQFELENAYANLGLQKGVNCLRGDKLVAGSCPAY